MILKETYNIDYAKHLNVFSANKIITPIWKEMFIMWQYVSHRVITKIWLGQFYVTDVVLQTPSEVSGLCSSCTGYEPATSDIPSAPTTNYANEKLVIRWRGWPVTYLRSEFHRYTPATSMNYLFWAGVVSEQAVKLLVKLQTLMKNWC